MRKFYSVVFLSIAFVPNTCYSQNHHGEKSLSVPTSYSNIFGLKRSEVQSGSTTPQAEVSVVAPAQHVRVKPTNQNEIQPSNETQFIPQQGSEEVTLTPTEMFQLKPVIQTSKALGWRAGNENPSLKKALDAVKSVRKFELSDFDNPFTSLFVTRDRRLDSEIYDSNDELVHRDSEIPMDSSADDQPTKLIRLVPQTLSQKQISEELPSQDQGRFKVVEGRSIAGASSQFTTPANRKTIQLATSQRNDFAELTKGGVEASLELVDQLVPEIEQTHVDSKPRAADGDLVGVKNAETSSQMEPSLAQGVIELKNGEIKNPSNNRRKLVKKKIKSLKSSQALPQSSQSQNKPEATLGFSAEDLNFDTLSIPSTASTDQAKAETSEKRGIAKKGAGLAASGAFAKKNKRRVKWNRHKASTGWWWLFIPLLPLPLLGWFMWGLSLPRKPIYDEVTADDEKSSYDSPVSSAIPSIDTEAEQPSNRKMTIEAASFDVGDPEANKSDPSVAAADRQSDAIDSTGRDSTRRQPSDNQKPSPPQIQADGNADDLTKILGINEEVQQVFHEAGYYGFNDIKTASPGDLQQVFAGENYHFTSTDFKTWSNQAAVRISAESVACNDRQFYEGEMSESVSGEDWTKKFASIARFLETGSGETCSDKTCSDETCSDETPSDETPSDEDSDDLTKIKGVGPASEKVLNRNGINSFAHVASMTSQQLKKLFEEMPDRSRLIDTSTWPEQAREFTSTGVTQQVASLDFELELLDEIDGIQSIAVDGNKLPTMPGQAVEAAKQE